MKRYLRRMGWFMAFTIALNTAVLAIVISLNRLAVDNCDLDDDVTAVIVGDSHTNWSIDAGDIARVENISFNAEGYVYSYFKLKQLLGKEPNIEKVYLGFGYHNLSVYFDEYVIGSLSRHFTHRYIGVMPLRDIVWITLRNPVDMIDAFKRIVSRGGRTALKRQCPLYGSFPEEQKMETYDASHMEKRIREQYYDDKGDVIGISEYNLEYLDKIIALLKEHDIAITLLNTPLHPDYVASIPAEFTRLYHDYIEQNDLEVYEFQDLVLDDSHFLPDGDHVNYPGAILTTSKFREYLESKDD